MQDVQTSIDVPLDGLDVAEWKDRLAGIADEHGHYQPLGDAHFSLFLDLSKTLLVTFETVQGIRALSDTAQPLGFDMVKAQGWSHLCLISDGDTWFRDARVYGYFDRLIDEGFFEDFDQVIFYGAGPCGYAAAAFSVAAPGATVIAIQPQATLDPRLTEWDDRFTEMRRTSFTDRYGYAPDMLDAADRAFVFYDPHQDLDAMHSALFHRSNVSRIRLANMGSTLQTSLIDMGLLYRVLTMVGAGQFSAAAFARLYRARRDYNPYLRNVMARLDAEERFYLTAALCRNVTARMNAPKFRRRLDALEKQAQAGNISLPPT